MALSAQQKADLLATVPQSAGPTQQKTPGPTQSVTLALREEQAERTTPPGIRPEFAHRPSAWTRGGYGRTQALGPGRASIQLMHDKLMQDAAPPRVICGYDPYRWMHTSMRDD
jgi:hypothetical protein